jgi:hypothetical protein
MTKDKFQEKREEFRKITTELISLFEKKNKHYGSDYFEGNYSETERWLSVRRKIARLQTYYSGETKEDLPDETLFDTWKDLAIYCIMELIILKGGNKNNGEKN